MKHQVSKDIVVAALLTDTAGRVLIVQPAHKEGWIFPGGYVEVGESPSAALRREVTAELGLEVRSTPRLLSVDYRGLPEEYVMFIFDAGTITDAEAAAIVLPPSLVAHRFVTVDEASVLLRPNSARRLLPTLEARKQTGIAYLEHQQPF